MEKKLANCLKTNQKTYIFYKSKKKALKIDQFCLELKKMCKPPPPPRHVEGKKMGRKLSIPNREWGKKINILV